MTEIDEDGLYPYQREMKTAIIEAGTITVAYLAQSIGYILAVNDAKVRNAPVTAKEAILHGYSQFFIQDFYGLTEEEYWLERNIALYTPIPLTAEDLKSIYCVREAEPKKDLAPWRNIPHKRGRAKRNRR